MSSQSVKSLLSTNKVGVLVRAFATEQKNVPSTVDGVVRLVSRLGEARVEGMPAFREVFIVIFADKRFGTRADCGELHAPLRTAVTEVTSAHPHLKVRIEEVLHGDLNWGILNYGFSGLHRAGCDLIASISPQSVSICTDKNLADVYTAFTRGAKAACLAVYDKLGIAQGCFSNACTVWDANALAGVGNFDERTAMPVDESRANWKRGYHPDLGFVWYLMQGVEEIAPLLRLVDQFGECLAPIIPVEALTQGEGGILYELPDRETSPDLWQRKMRQLVTKRCRQNTAAESSGRNLACLKGGVMREYRVSPLWESPVTL
jgi:hypothetical protein